MTDPNKAAIMLVVDRSGSMLALRHTAQSAINEFITAQQRYDGVRRTIAIAHFDDQYELVTPSMPVNNCPAYKLEPGGCTALLDAMGRAINDLGAELAALPESKRPSKVILGVVTDGFENSSKEFTWDKVKEMVRHQEDVYGWQVVYLAADQDAIATGAKMGVRAGRSLSYNSTDHNTRAVYDSFSGAVYAASSAGGQSVNFTDEDREAAVVDEPPVGVKKKDA